MAQDVNKHLERARRNVEKNKLRDAVSEYQSVLEEVPSNQEALQALADLYSRLNEPSRAAHYYGLQFDRFVEAGDNAKASAIFSRFLRSTPQPPERLMRYAVLLQRQNRAGEPNENYSSAADRFREQRRNTEALACFEKITQLDPDNPARHIVLAELAETLEQLEMAARAFLRAGQLKLAAGGLDQALELFARGYRLAPEDSSGALFYAEARLRKGDAPGAVALLEPFSPSETDLMFLTLFGDALLRTGQLDRARQSLEAYYRQKQDSFAKLFELALAYFRAGQDPNGVAVLSETKEWMRGVRREGEFAAQLDHLAGLCPASLGLAEFIARFYEEMNREAKYFDALVRLFDLYMEVGNIKSACEVLDRLLDIDPYDYRNQERIARLEGKADPAYLRSVHSRAAKAATIATRGEGFTGAGLSASEHASQGVSEDVRAQQALDDLIVQVEIFLQYSLQTKAVERLQRIAELFPAEEEKNERLRSLFERANWWPKGAPAPSAPSAVKPLPSPTEAPLAHPASYSADTHRDLAAIAEITRLMYRQATANEVLASAVQGIGKHLGVARCVVTLGAPGEPGQITAESSAPGLPPAVGPALVATVGLLAELTPDSLGGIELRADQAPALRELGLVAALGVRLTDKETQTPAGTMLVGETTARKWKPNESFFLQAIGDQLVISANHTRLRNFVRTLAVADEKTGLLSRGAYIDCLMAEANRAKTQNSSLSLVILQVDRGAELLRQQGEAPLEGFMEQLARTLKTAVRQTDVAVKYTAWSLAFILPDTTLESASTLAEKLRQLANSIPVQGNGPAPTLSAVVAEASRRPGDETEDRVTEWINRVEAGLDDLRQHAGNAMLALRTP